jgi:hypothetical protein
MKSDALIVETQSVLDHLWAKKLIPFQLTAHKIESLGLDEYVVRFHDSRLRSVDVSWREPDSFRDAIRVAILARVARLSGPLRKQPEKY